MKKILIIISVLLFLYSCNNKTTTVEGTFENFKNNKVTLSYATKTDTVTLNDKGEFKTDLNIKEPVYMAVRVDENSFNIFIEPQTKTVFKGDSGNLFQTIEFSGDDATINDYLIKQNSLIAGSGVNSEEFLYSSDFAVFKSSLSNLISQLNNNLNELEASSGNKYRNFINLEKQRINLVEGYLLLAHYVPYINKNSTSEEIETAIDEQLKNIDVNNPSLLNIQEFKGFIPPYVGYRFHKKVQNDKLEFNTIEQYSNAYFETIDEIFENNQIKEEQYYNLINEFLAYYGYESVKDAYEKYKGFAKNEERLATLETKFAEYTKLNPGNPSIEFSFPDVDGKMHSLSDFRGKYVYIDVWASWCGPCRTEFPYLKELKEKFKSKNIEIIGISVDENRNQWINMMESQGLGGTQIYAGGWNNSFVDFYKITGIPRFILLDRDGNIINSNAERPSGNIEEILNSLEGI